MNKKAFMFTALILTCAIFLYLPVSTVTAQPSSTAITSVSPQSGDVSSIVTVQGTITTANSSYSITLGDMTVFNGTAEGYNVSASFVVPPLPPKSYSITLHDTVSGDSATQNFDVITTIPQSTLLVMVIALVISFIVNGLSRFVTTRICGWQEYRIMQKEVREHQSQMMRAARANDQKLVEKLKKKQPQIDAMQKKMMKPQLILFPINLVYFAIWYLVLIPVFGITAVAYLPGIGPISVLWWYPICSVMFGALASKVIGIMPIE